MWSCHKKYTQLNFWVVELELFCQTQAEWILLPLCSSPMASLGTLAPLPPGMANML